MYIMPYKDAVPCAWVALEAMKLLILRFAKENIVRALLHKIDLTPPSGMSHALIVTRRICQHVGEQH